MAESRAHHGRTGVGPVRARAAALSERAAAAAYALLFCAVLPALLWAWAAAVPGLDRLPAPRAPVAGVPLLLAGGALWLWGVSELLRRGDGLPMNAFPTRRLVRTGPFELVAHPIYAGFVLLVAGVALAAGSAAGLWLVLPVVIAAAAALVLGYESPTLRRRFGTLPTPWLSLAPAADTTPTAPQRAAASVLAFAPWLLVWLAVEGLGVPADAFALQLPLDRVIPVLAWSEPVYASCYLVPAVVLLLPTQRALRDFVITAWAATVVVGVLWLFLPVIALPRAIEVRSRLDAMLALERLWSNGTAALPSFHVLWALFAADAVARARPRWRTGAWLWAAAVTVSCLTTGMHNVADIIAALALYPLLARPRASWARLRAATEQVANGWREWRVGGVRIINHGIFAGLAGAVALLTMLQLAPGSVASAVVIALAGLLGAGLWAQLIEAGSGLSRPFGYFGAVFGAAIAALALNAFGMPGTRALAALAVAAPAVQALGRIRCLIQGCCHGAPASETVGIRHVHPRSRVCYLAHLGGQPIHPTALYSILANVVLGLLLLRLWLVSAPEALIVGLYLVGAGVSRFVEEAYRGEPQTPWLLGMRLYQWLAVLFVLAGAGITALPSALAPVPHAPLSASAIALSLGFGTLTAFAMGVDFPASKRRFTRLATP